MRTKANNGTLKLFPGNGLGGFKASKIKGTGWNFYNELFGSFDLSGDGLADIVGRDGDRCAAHRALHEGRRLHLRHAR